MKRSKGFTAPHSAHQSAHARAMPHLSVSGVLLWKVDFVLRLRATAKAATGMSSARPFERLGPCQVAAKSLTSNPGVSRAKWSGMREAGQGATQNRYLTAPRASAVSLNGLLGRVHRPADSPRRQASQALSEALDKAGERVVKATPSRSNRFLMGALGLGGFVLDDLLSVWG